MSIPAAAAMAELTDDDLVAMLGPLTDDGEIRALLAELERRDTERQAAERRAREARARRRADPVTGEWRDMAHAQYLAAEAATCGVLLNRRGIAAGIDPWALWRGPQHIADAYCSEELRNFWRDNPRITVPAFRGQLAAQREAYAHERDAELVTDDTRPVRPGTGASAGRAAAAGTDGHDGHRGPAGPAAGRERAVSVVYSAMRAASRSAGRRDPQRERRSEALAARAAELRAGRTARELAASGPFPAGTVAVRDTGTVARRQQSVDGAAVLGYTRQVLTRYARFPSAAAADLAALWAAHAHFRDADGTLVWQATPRLLLLSSEPGSGKSRVLELLGWLCPATFGLDTEPTAAGLSWTLSAEHATGLLDEGDILFGAGKRHASIRAILNAGYTRNGTVLRMRGSRGERQRVFGPVALAGLDVLETATGESLAPLFSRSIVVRMRRSTDAVPALDPEGCAAAAKVRTALGLWASQARDTAAQARPDLPGWLANRLGEIWTPILAIADAAGGEWPGRARQAAEELARFADVDRGEDGEDGDVMADLGELTAGW